MKPTIRGTLILRASTLLWALAPLAHAQTVAQIDFDKLPRGQHASAPSAAPSKSDSTKHASRRPERSEGVGPKSGSHPFASLRATETAVVTHVDTVHVFITDTVRYLTRVETLKVVTPAPAVQTVPGVVPAAPAFTVGGLTQVILMGGDLTRTTYRLRRVEVKLTSDLGNKAQGVVMVDAAKALSLNTAGATPSVTQSSRILQDAYITVPVSRLAIDAGQQRLPLGYEGSIGASSLPTVERALMESDKARSASFGDVRDAGVAVRQSWQTVDYRVGLFNGSGESMNDIDKHVGKSVIGKIAFRPTFLPGLHVGASGTTSGPAAGDKPTRDRVGADVGFVRGSFTVETEAMTGQDASTRRAGGYAIAFYSLVPRLELVTRFDAWDPDRAAESSAATATERDYLGGFNWLPAGTRLKLQLNVVRKTYSAGLVPSSTVVLSQLQASW